MKAVLVTNLEFRWPPITPPQPDYSEDSQHASLDLWEDLSTYSCDLVIRDTVCVEPPDSRFKLE